MFFSIIVPVYNVEKYLAECLDSILAQTFRDYELIVVNDGAKDNSGKICDEYAEKDSRVKVIHKENGGSSDARNVGANKAKGEYIIYIDSDDYILSMDFLQVLHDNLGEADILLYKHQKLIDGSEKMLPCTYSYQNISEKDSYIEKLEKLVAEDAFYGMAWIKTFKRTLIVEHKIEFEVGLLGEDMEWNYNLITHARSLNVVDRPFIAYRQRANSITTSTRLKNLTDFIYILEKWSLKINEEIQDETFRNVLFASMAKYYSNMLITYNRVKEKEKKLYVKQIKKLSWLLEYAMSKRPKIVAKVYRLFGFRLTTAALKLVDKR